MADLVEGVVYVRSLTPEEVKTESYLRKLAWMDHWPQRMLWVSTGVLVVAYLSMVLMVGTQLVIFGGLAVFVGAFTATYQLLVRWYRRRTRRTVRRLEYLMRRHACCTQLCVRLCMQCPRLHRAAGQHGVLSE